MDMKERLQELAEAARKRIEESDGPDKLNEVKVAYLGKKGELTALLKSMKQAKIDAKYFFLFSAKGFSEEIRQLAEEDTRYILVDMNEL